MFDVGESGFYPFLPTGTALNGHFYDDAIGVDPPVTSTWADNFWNNGYGDSGTYSGTDASGNPVSGPVNGSVTVHLDGQIPAYFKEVWQGSGAPTTPMPDYMDFLLSTDVSASASVNYGSSGLSSGLSATATATDGDPFNETASASAGDAGPGSGPARVLGHHLVRASVNSGTGIAEVYLKGTTDWMALNQVPYMVPSSAGNTPATFNGNTDASASGYISVGISQDSRDVEITSSNIETSYFKGTVDDTHPTDQWQHLRGSDGSIVTDSAVSPPLTQPGGGSTWTADPTLLGQAGGFQLLVFAWSVKGEGTLSASGNTAHTQLAISFPLSTTDKALNKQSTVRVDVTDSDNATAANTFAVKWHYPKENATLIASGTPFWQEAVRKSVTSAGYIDGDATGIFGYSTYTDLFPVVADDLFPVAANGTPATIWSAFVAAVGLALSQIQPTQTTSTANFDQCWNSPYSTGVPSPADPALMNEYQMNPLLVVEYQEQTWQYEEYDQHGYTGLANEGIDHFMGSVQSAGEFSRTGPPPPGGG